MVKKLLKQIRVKDSYSQSAVLILLYKFLIVTLTFFTTPIIARFYAPEDYGIYALLNSIVVLFSILSSWSLSSEIVICKEKELSPLINFTLQIGLILTFALTIGLVLIKSFIFSNIEFNSWFLIVIPMLVMLTNVTKIFAILNIREKQFKKNIVVNTSDVSATKISSVTLGLFGFTSFGLILGDVMGKLVNAIIQINKKKDVLSSVFSLNKFLYLGEMKDLITKYKSYWKYQMPSNLTQIISTQVLVWSLALFYSKTELGYFSMAVGLVAIPLNLFSNSFQPIITRKFTEEKMQSKRVASFDKILLQLTLISLTVYLGIFLVCDWFIDIYLGNNWIDSVKFVKLLCILYSSSLISNSLSGLYIVFGQQKLNFKIKIAFTLFLLTALAIYFNIQNVLITAIIIYVSIGAVEEIVRVFMLRKKIVNYV